MGSAPKLSRARYCRRADRATAPHNTEIDPFRNGHALLVSPVPCRLMQTRRMGALDNRHNSLARDREDLDNHVFRVRKNEADCR